MMMDQHRPPSAHAAAQSRRPRFLFTRRDAGETSSGPAPLSTSVLALILIVLAVLAYANTLNVPFIFDDIPNIVDNPHIRWPRISLGGIVDAGFNSPSSHRPVANVSFALNRFLHGDGVAGYHLVNISIHAISGVALFLLLKTTLLLPGANGARPAAAFAFWVAALWLVHPVNTQTVTYIVQRMNGLAAMFTLAALYGYARARIASRGWKKRALFGVCTLSAVLALGSKENAVTLPFFIFLYEWYFFQDVSRVWIRRQAPLLICMALTGAAIAGLYLGASPLDRILADYAHRDFTPLQRVLTQSRVIVFYAFLLLFPHPSRLNLDHDFQLSSSLTDPLTTLASVLVLCGTAAAAGFTARRCRGISFLIWWFLGNLVIESSVIGLELVFEHRTYLPGIAVCCLLVAGVYRWIRPFRLRLAALATIVIVFSVWTVARNAVWQDDLRLWADSAAKSPNKARPRNKLGVSLERRGRIDEAMAQYREVLRIDPQDAYAYYNMGNVYQKQGKLADAEDSYRKALQLVPDHKLAHNNLGVVLADFGRSAAAAEQFRQALSDDPGFFSAHRNLGAVLIDAGDISAAIDHLKMALKINPSDADAHYLLGNAYRRQGSDKAAFSQYTQALKHNPDHVDAHTNAGMLLANSGQVAAAVAHFQAAARLRPRDPQVRVNLDRALMAMKEKADQ